MMDKKENGRKRLFIISLGLIALLISIGFYIYSRSLVTALVALIISVILLITYALARTKLKETGRVRKMEESFPDFLQLMSSNLRAGMTIDRALLLSSRKEFDPLDKEILALGKKIVTGERVEDALDSMSKMINSKKISKTIELITSGIKSGGNLAVLLEETSSNMREKNFIEKKASSNVLMYVIFIFFAATIGAPMLFSLSVVLVEILTNILSTIPSTEVGLNLPFTLSKINISTTFITYFTLIFLIVTDVLSSLVIGLVSRGEEKEGFKFMIPIITLSLIVFFGIKIILTKYFFSSFG